MKFSLNIDYPVEKMEKSRKRMTARDKFEYYDRVPVNFCAVPRYFTKIFGIDYSEIFKNAETHYYWLLQFAKYHIENIPCDFCTYPVLYVYPYFDNVVVSSAFGAEVAWPKNETLQAVPVMKDFSEIKNFKIPEPDAGLCGRTIDWCRQMEEFTRNTELTFNGQKSRVEVAPVNFLGLGPHMIAVDLIGPDFYWWMIEYPEECHMLLDKITKGIILIEENARRISPSPRGTVFLAEDSSQIMSAEMFKEFTVPYDKILYEKFCLPIPNSRAMHMCGDSAHLHKSLIEDLQITDFYLFGSRVPPKVAAKNLGGKTRLYGNIDPVLLLNGSKEEVKKACMEALDEMAPCRGLMLGDGANVCPVTPLENLGVLVEASEEYSKLHPELFTTDI